MRHPSGIPLAAERVAYTQLDPPIGLCGAHLVDDAARDLPEVGRAERQGKRAEAQAREVEQRLDHLLHAIGRAADLLELLAVLRGTLGAA